MRKGLLAHTSPAGATKVGATVRSLSHKSPGPGMPSIPALLVRSNSLDMCGAGSAAPAEL